MIKKMTLVKFKLPFWSEFKFVFRGFHHTALYKKETKARDKIMFVKVCTKSSNLLLLVVVYKSLFFANAQ